MLQFYLGRYGRPSVSRINIWRYKSQFQENEKLLNPLLIRKPIKDGIDNFVLACSACELELGNQYSEIIEKANEASNATMILSTVHHKSILSLSTEYTR